VPVVDDNHIRSIGVITETDIFRAFVEMLGGGEQGLRLTVQVPAGSAARWRNSPRRSPTPAATFSASARWIARPTAQRDVIVKVRGVSKDKDNGRPRSRLATMSSTPARYNGVQQERKLHHAGENK
jgi:acetoin utilization protein AcuB